MKKFLFIFLLFHSLASAQKSDNMWLMGYHYFPSFVPALDFYYGSPDTIAWNAAIDFRGADASICSPSGDLLFYTNGVGICNFLNDTLAGSSQFNYDSTSMGAPYYIDNMPSQSAIILPFPGHPNQFYVFHLSMNVFNSSQYAQPTWVAASIVDMNANGGAGLMTVKNQILAADTLLYFTMQATKHGNGRDWWVVVHRWKSNAFYKMLLTPSGVTPASQQEGPYFAHNTAAGGQSVFSPDGSKFAMARSDSNMVYLFDFDRCSGMFTFRETISFAGGYSVTGCSFSPDSRFLYVNSYIDLFQYDVLAPQAGSTQIHIGTWDGAGGFNPYYFGTHRLGPDGVIYISTPTSTYLHTINNPNLEDTLCDFTQHSLKLKSYHYGALPEFPNYRLGNLPGSPCDTLNFSSMDEFSAISLSVYPNPASEIVHITFPEQKGSPGHLELFDNSGRLVYSKQLSNWSYRNTLSVSHLQKGLYLLRYTDDNGMAVCRVAVH